MENWNWSAFNVGIVIIGGIVTGATVYLRMFIQTQMNSLEKSIMTSIEMRFPQKQYVDMQIGEHERRLQRIETKMETIRITKEHEDHRE